MLRFSSEVPLTSLGTINAYTNTGYARVSVSSTRVIPGDTITVYVSGFPANAEIDYQVGPRNSDAAVIYDGTVNSSGTSSATVTIPSDADVGEYWTVRVVTTSQLNVVKVTSLAIYVGTTSASSYTYYGYGLVRVSATRAQVGDTITVTASGFPAYADIDFRVGQSGAHFTAAYDATASSSGTASQTITIPSEANIGEYWVVQVITTGQAKIVSANSPLIYIGTTSATTTYSYAKVSLSSTQAAAGGTVTATASGFPANLDIDYRVGKQGEAFSVTYDATTDSSGASSQVITLPSSAVSGEYWVVKVVTTEIKNAVSATSHTIYIP